MSLLVSDSGFLLDQNIVLGLAAVSGTGGFHRAKPFAGQNKSNYPYFAK